MRTPTHPLLLPALGLMGGILLGQRFRLGLWEIAIALAVATAATVLSRYRRLYAAGLFVCLGVLIQWWRPPGRVPQLDAASGEIVLLEGCVVEPPALSEGREQFVMELAPSARVRVNYYWKDGEQPPALAYGDRVEVEARVRTPRNFQNPGAFDYKAYLARREIYWTATVASGAHPKVLSRNCGHPLLAALYAIRTYIVQRTEQFYPNDPYAVGILQALLIGESARLERVWAESYRRTGTYHAIVISGLHITVVAGVIVMLLRFLTMLKGNAQLAAALATWIYAGMCGWQIPVVRAAAGFTLFAVGRFFFRECRLVNLLAAIAIGFLVADPQGLTEASFQFSFLSVLALGVLAQPAAEATTAPLRNGLRDLADEGRDLHLAPRVAQFRIELRLIAETLYLAARIPMPVGLRALAMLTWMLFAAFETALVSLTVQAGLALPMVTYFHRLSLTGITANILVTPLLTAAVPTGFVAALTGWAPFAWITLNLVKLSRIVADWHASAEPNLRVPDPPMWLAAAFALSLIAVAVFRRRVLLLPVALSLALILWHPFPPVFQPGTLELTMIDVGQGECLLVGMPDGRWMVIDGGGIPVFRNQRVKPRMEIGEDVVTPYLLSRSIRRIDYLVNTHQHDDHAAGLPALIRNFRPRELWAGATPESPVWKMLTEEAARHSAVVRTLRRGHTESIAGVRITVLAPAADYTPRSAPSNDDSIVLRLDHGANCFLLTGDAERAVEARLAADLQSCNVLKVGHHGSRTSTTEPFLEALHPAFALISAGSGNLFRHPHADVVKRLESHGTRVYRTDVDGLVTIRSDGVRLSVESWQVAESGMRLSPF
jgi:competence protein ComEC